MRPPELSLPRPRYGRAERSRAATAGTEAPGEHGGPPATRLQRKATLPRTGRRFSRKPAPRHT
jgi:hypothetical protein